jgi:hypothetical protein
MQERAAKARRILAAQQQLHRIEQWKLAELQRELADLTSAQMEIIGALNDSNALHGLFIDTTARRLGTLAEEAERVTRRTADQSLRTTEHAVRVRASERLEQAVTQELERELEGKELLEVIEQYLATKVTSLP